jgi:hypothetical protein
MSNELAMSKALGQEKSFLNCGSFRDREPWEQNLFGCVEKA